MRENVRCRFQRNGWGILGRVVVTGALGLGSCRDQRRERRKRCARPFGTDMAGTRAVLQDDPEHHLHLDPAQPGGRGRHLHPHGEGGASGNPVTFSIDPSANGSCSMSGATVTFVAVGTCVIDANQAGNASYEAATQVQQSFAVVGTQTHHLHLDPAQPRGRGRHLHGDGERRGKWQPGHLLHRPLGEWKLQHVGCDRHLRRRRDLRHRRQPGRQRQLRGRHPGPAVLHRRSAPRASPSPRPRPTPRSSGRTYTATASGGASGNPVTFSIDPSANAKLQHLGCDRHLRRRRDLRHRRQPGRQRQLRRRPPGPAVLRSVATAPRASPSPRPRPAPRSSGAPTPATASGGASGNPVTFSIDPSAHGSCTHLGCDRHLRRRRDLRHRRQPGRQRQLRSRHPGPAVLRRGLWYPDHHLHLDPAQRRGRAGAPTPRRRRGGASGNPVTFSIDPSAHRKLHHLGCDRHLRRRRDLRHRRQPGRQRQL